MIRTFGQARQVRTGSRPIWCTVGRVFTVRSTSSRLFSFLRPHPVSSARLFLSSLSGLFWSCTHQWRLSGTGVERRPSPCVGETPLGAPGDFLTGAAPRRTPDWFQYRCSFIFLLASMSFLVVYGACRNASYTRRLPEVDVPPCAAPCDFIPSPLVVSCLGDHLRSLRVRILIQEVHDGRCFSSGLYPPHFCVARATLLHVLLIRHLTP